MVALTPTSSRIAAGLVAAAPRASGSDPTNRVVDALALTWVNLCRYLGTTGCHALFSRALRDATRANSAIEKITIKAERTFAITGISDSIRVHGADETAAGLTSLLESVIDLLGRLIGEQLAMKLLEPPDGQ